jgi:serine/threonine protein kinase
MGQLLENEPVATFVVGSNPYPGTEYTVYVTASEGVHTFDVEESAALNGGVLYQYRGGARYSNLLTLVQKELKGKAGLKEQGTAPRAQVPAADQRAYVALPAVAAAAAPAVPVIGKGRKFGKKQVGDVRVSHIRSESGNEYIVSNTQAQGGFGKFRFAVDRDGKRWAVKEFRSEFARHKDNPKTYVTNMDAIKDEIAIMQKVGASVTVKEAMNINGKVYAVMPIMSGEVGDLPKAIARADRRCVARSVLRQMADDLGQCHRRGYVHRDVKLANALWNPDGKVAVSDFGLAAKAPKRGRRLGGIAGTPGYIGPEAYNGEGTDARIDTWSLALSVAEIHVDWWESPFVLPRRKRGGAWESKNFREFEVWRKGLITPKGLDTGLIKGGWFGGGSKWDSYFSKLLNADPVLCEFMLTHMLVSDPAGRASMEEVSQFMNTVQSAMSRDEAQAKKAFNTLAGDSRKKDEVFKVLDAER